ncbi:MAG: hypothetical protein IT381_12685 [Deltaproteobacteria bacterium]|nr:hypothetical protein [Deltaproteobacteria bacterium]
MGNTEAGVRELLEELIDVVPEDALAPLDLSEVLDDVVTELEERFGITLTAPTKEQLRSVSAITALVGQKQREKRPAK